MFTEYPYQDFSNYNLDWIIKRVKEYIEKFNELNADVDTYRDEVAALRLEFADLQDFVNEYFSNVDLQEEVDARLNEMLDSGELENVISNAFNHIKQFQAQRVFRIPFDWGTAALQAIAYNGDDTVYYGGNHSNQDSAYFYVGHLDGSIDEGGPRILTYEQVGHVNSMAFKNGALYIATASDPYGQIRIVSVDVSDWHVIRNYNISEALYSAGYIDDPDKLSNVTGVSIDGSGRVIIAGHLVEDYRTCRLYALNTDTGAVTEVGKFTMPKPDAGTYNNTFTRQGMGIVGDTVYVMYHNPSAIVKYRLGDPENIFTVIETGDGNGFYPYGEIENAVDIGGQLYLYSAVYLDDPNATRGFGNLWKTNLEGPVWSDVKTRVSVVDNEALYVDSTSVSVNPNGESAVDPQGIALKAFPTCEEASTVINYLNKHRNPQYLQVYVRRNTTATDLLLLQNANYRVATPDSQNIPTMCAYNCTVAVRAATIGTFNAQNANVNINGSSVGTINAADSRVYMAHTTCGEYALNRSTLDLSRPWGNWYEANVTNAAQSKITGVPALNRMAAGGSHTMSNNGVIFDLTGFVQGYIEKSTSSDDVPFTVVWRDGQQGDHAETLFTFRLLSSDLTNLRGGTTVTRYAYALVKDGQGVAGVVLQAEFDPDQIAFTIKEVDWLSQGSGNPTGGLYDFRLAL